MQLAVGDLVVYGGHGTGRVVARGSDEGRRDVVVLEFDDGLTVTLPIERAREHLRPLATEDQIARIRRTLRSVPPENGDVWLKRRKATQEKLVAGGAIGLAEVVRDGAHRDAESLAGGGSRLSLSERELYLRARRLLAGEIGFVRGVERSEADDWIALQLSCSEG